MSITPLSKADHAHAPAPSPHTASHAAPKLGNPAVVGLAGFALSTLLLQFHNVGGSPLARSSGWGWSSAAWGSSSPVCRK